MKNSAISIFIFVAFTACNFVSRMDFQAQSLEVYKIETGTANVYLIKTPSSLVMVDTGSPSEREKLLDGIRKAGFQPSDVRLIVLTHGHGDHAGNARYFQQNFKTIIAGGAADEDMFSSGKTELSKAEGIGFLAGILRLFSDQQYDSFEPDVKISSETDLSTYGFPGKAVTLPGHTPGSVIVVTGKSAFVGDLIRGGVVFKTTPVEHFFHENRTQAREQLRKLLTDGVQFVYPGHFGPLALEDLRKYLE